MIIQNAKVFGDTGFEKRDLCIEGERIVTASEKQERECIDAERYYAVPGLIDVHLHGCIRHDFSSADVAGINEMLHYQAKNGVTGLCPTTMTLPEARIEDACKNVLAAGSKIGASILGIYLEGPLLSPRKAGAQNPEHMHRPDVEMFWRLQKASGGLAKVLAIAPELDGAMELIETLRDEVRCSIAHTTADYDTAMRAFDKGALQVTHLYNAMPAFLHREPGVVGAAFDSPQSMVELICDGIHVHPALVRATFKMFGDERIMMVSDSMMATGLEDGSYVLGDLPVTVIGNKAVLDGNGAIAGSVTNLMNCLRIAVKDMRISFHSAVKCASKNPARALGVEEDYGHLGAGAYADIVLLDEDLQIRKVILHGKDLAV